MLNTMLIFAYIISKQRNSVELLVSMENDYILPLGKIREKFLQYSKGKVTAEEYQTVSAMVIKQVYETLPEETSKEKTDNSDIFFLFFFIVGVSLIAISILAPTFN